MVWGVGSSPTTATIFSQRSYLGGNYTKPMDMSVVLVLKIVSWVAGICYLPYIWRETKRPFDKDVEL
jgi:hypothetical protein